MRNPSSQDWAHLLTFFMALISGGQAQSRRELLGFIKFGGLEIESKQGAG